MVDDACAGSGSVLLVPGPISTVAGSGEGYTVSGHVSEVVESKINEVGSVSRRQRKRYRDNHRKKKLVSEAKELQETMQYKFQKYKAIEENMMTLKAQKSLLERLGH